MNDDIKQVIVVRTDLNMRKGKMIAQGAHASLSAILRNTSIKKNKLTIELTEEMKLWLSVAFTKIVLKASSEAELFLLYETAKRANLPASLICDSGKTEFHGVPTYTAVAIGPAASEEIDKITGNLQLL